MPLHQFCSSTGGSKSASRSPNAPFGVPTPIPPQEVYDVKWTYPLERCASETSTLSFSKDICRICHYEGDEEAPLIAPCYCAGSLRYVHQGCLQQWIKSSDTKCCELCKFLFIMNTKMKPFNKWENLDMTGLERRKILCSVIFHAIAITCVVWSLFVLIQRTSQEVQSGEWEWPFWTKLIVVAIGFTGSIVFMYVQCKMYVHLCRRWKAFNRVIYVQNAPEKAKIPLTVIRGNGKVKPTQSPSTGDVENQILGVAVVPNTTSQALPPTLQATFVTSSPNNTSTSRASLPGSLLGDEPQPPNLSASFFHSGLSADKRGSLENSPLISNGGAESDRKVGNDEGFSNGLTGQSDGNLFQEIQSDRSDVETLHLEKQ